MKKFLSAAALLLIAFTLPVVGGCQSDKHAMVEARPGMTVVCKDCYEKAVQMTHSSGSLTEQTHKVHQCPSCKTEMSTYVEKGVAMIKCAKCAPSGLACDKCMPSGSYESETR